MGAAPPDPQPESRPLEDRQPRGAQTGWAPAPAGSAARVRLVGGPRARAARFALSLLPGRRAPALGTEMGRRGAVLDARLGHLPARRGHVCAACPSRPRPVHARLAVRARRTAAADVDLPAGVPQPAPQQDARPTRTCWWRCRRATSGWRARFTCARRRCTAACATGCWCRPRCCSRGSAAATRAWPCSARWASG